MGIATHDLQETIRVRHECAIVNATSVHLPKAEFAALGNKAPGLGELLILGALVGQSWPIRGTVDYHARLFKGLLRRVHGLDTEFFKGTQLVWINGQPGTPAHEVVDFRAVIETRAMLVKRNLVNCQHSLGIQEQTNERLTDGPGAHHVQRTLRLHMFSPSPSGIALLGVASRCLVRVQGHTGLAPLVAYVKATAGAPGRAALACRVARTSCRARCIICSAASMAASGVAPRWVTWSSLPATWICTRATS